MKDYESENAVFPKLHRRNSSCNRFGKFKNQQQPSESSSKEKQEDKLRKTNL